MVFRPNISKLKVRKDVDRLVRALKYPDGRVRCDAVVALAELGPLPRTFDPLVGSMKDGNETVELAAIEALAGFRSREAAEVLLSHSARCSRIFIYGPRSSDEETALGGVLERYRDRHKVDRVLQATRSALVATGLPAVQALIANPDTDIRGLCIGALRGLDKLAVEPLLAALANSESAGDRAKAIDALFGDGEFDNSLVGTLRTTGHGEGASSALIGRLTDDDPLVRFRAASALGRAVPVLALDTSAAFDALSARLAEEPDASVRRFVVSALGGLGDRRAVLLLLRSLRDAEIAGPAIGALGSLGDPRAVKPLIAKLRARDTTIRIAAALALGELGDSSALPALERTATQDEVWEQVIVDRDQRGGSFPVRIAAKSAVEKIQSGRA